MERETREQILVYLQNLIDTNINRATDRQIDEIDTPENYLRLRDPHGKLQPFYAAMIPAEVRRISTFQRGLVTGIGTSFEECARLIALENHADAQRSYDLSGEVSLNALNEIERRVAQFEHAAEEGTTRPTLNEMVAAVLAANDDGDTERRTARADLYVLGHDGTEYFFELKSPYANKGQCLEVTQRLLRLHLLRDHPRPQVQAYFALPYNPYGLTHDDYNWSIVRLYTPFEQAVVIGQSFWQIIGGDEAYAELLGLYQLVGQHNADRITALLDD